MKPKKITKKQFTMAALVIALALAVYLNWRFSAETPYSELPVTETLGNEEIIDTEKNYGDAEFVSNNNAETGDYFAQARLSRQQTHDSAIDTLEKALSQNDLTEAEKTELAAQLAQLNENATMESNIESVILAKGFGDCVVIISDSGVKVIVKAPEGGLDDVAVAQIAEAVISETGVTADKINIVEVN